MKATAYLPDGSGPADSGPGTARRFYLPRWQVLAVFAVGCALTMYMWSGLRALVEQRSDERFGTDVGKLVEQVETRMQVYAALLAAGAGLHEASEGVTAAEWKVFTDTLNLSERYPGLQGYGYAARVPVDGRLKFEEQQRRTQGSGFRIRPEGPREESHPIVFLEPQDERNRKAIGFDLYSEPVRRAAMERASQFGTVQISAPVKLLWEAGGTQTQPGVLMFHPVYRRAPVSGVKTTAEKDLKGFVYAPFRMHELMNAMVGARPPGFQFTLMDRGGGIGRKEVVLYSHLADKSSGGIRGKSGLERERGFSIAGRVWSIRASAPRDYGAQDSAVEEAGLVVGGAVLSLLLAFIVHMLMRTRDKALALAAGMTSDLEASRRRFERMVAGTSDGTWEYDAQSKKGFLSPRFREILGFEPVEAVVDGIWVSERAHSEDRRAAVKAFTALKVDGDILDQELRMRMADDTYRWFRVRGRLFKDGRSLVVAGSMSDVNEEHEARFREARLVTVVEMSPDLFMTFDLEGRATYLNAAARRIFGEVASDSLAGFSVAGMFSQSEVDRVFNEGVPTAYMQDYWEGETELITAAGEVLPVSQVILSHKNEAGQVEFYSTVMRDISERRLSMQALTEAQERLQRALDASRDGIWERDVRTDAFSTSDRLAEILGYAPDEMPSTREGWRALNHPDDLPISDASVARLAETGETVVWDTRMRTKSGEYRWMRRRGRMVRDAHGDPLLTAGTLTDIHESKMAEFSLRELQARYQRALDGTNDGMWEMDEVTGAFECSARFCELIGWTVAHAPRDRNAIRNLIHPADVDGHFAAVAVMQSRPGAHSWDIRVRNGEGGYRWQRFRGIATRAPDGSLLLTSGTISDITEARLAEIELRRHRDNLAHLVEERTAGLEQARLDAEASREAAERANLAKSEFLANMSHELRTPMHAIISFANFGVDKSDRAERDKLLHYFRNIQKSGSRLLSLLNDLLDLSKLEAGKMDMAMAPVNAAALLADVIVEAEAFAQNRNIQLVLEADPARLGVVWDGPRVLQVIRNLVSNAVKFSMADGRVVISAQPVLLPAGRRAGDPQVPGIEIRVCDAGIGIPEDELETVFDKFVQSSKTKTGAGGTGLGLAICREIVLAHQGSIRAENNPAPQPGATFVVLMPVTPSVARQSRGAALSQPQERVEEVK